METKIAKIVRYMRTHVGITQMDAYDLCKATRLSAIIHILKNRGYEIVTFYYPMKSGGRYAEYRLTDKYKNYLSSTERKVK